MPHLKCLMFKHRQANLVPALALAVLLGSSSQSLAAPGFLNKLFGKKTEVVASEIKIKDIVSEKAEAQFLKRSVLTAMNKLVVPVISDDGEVRPRAYFAYMNSIAEKISGKGSVKAQIVLDSSTVKPFIEYVLVMAEDIKNEELLKGKVLTNLEVYSRVQEVIEAKSMLTPSDVPSLKSVLVSVQTTAMGPGGMLQEATESQITEKIFALRKNESVEDLDPERKIVVGGQVVRSLKSRIAQTLANPLSNSERLFLNISTGHFANEADGGAVEVFRKIINGTESIDIASVRQQQIQGREAVNLFDFSGLIDLHGETGAEHATDVKKSRTAEILAVPDDFLVELTEEEAGIFFCESVFK